MPANPIAVYPQTSSGGMQLIQKQVVVSPVASISVSSIPQTYTNLMLVITGLTSNGTPANLLIQFNGDTGNNYFTSGIICAVGGVAWNGSNGTSSAFIGSLDNAGSSSVNAWINAYSQTALVKTLNCMGIFNNPTFNAGSSQGGVVWNSAAAITSLVLTLSAGNFVAGTTCSLYGLQ